MMDNIQQDTTLIEICSLPQNTKQQLNLVQWSYLSEGSYHIVFKNQNQHSKLRNYVLFLCKRQPHSGIDSIINNHYLEQLQKSQLSKFTVKSQKYCLINPIKDGVKLEQLIKKNIKSGYYQCSLKDNYQFILSQNLFSQLQQYDIVAQVKTKAITPDIYLNQMLQKVGEELGIDIKQIQYHLKNSDPIQKTKWFKSKIAFNKRENDSSFHYYGLQKYTNQNFVFDCLQTKKAKINKQVYTIQEMNKIFVKQLQASGILRTIHNILDEVNEPKSLSQYPNYQQYDKLPFQLPKIMSQIISNKNKTNFEDQYKILQEQCCYKSGKKQNQIEEVRIEQKKWINLYKYLIFTCISDMSIVGKIKIDSLTRQAIHSQFKILDYQLISLKHVNKRIAKYQSVFDRFLDYKGLKKKYGYQNANQESKQIDMKKQTFVISQNMIIQQQRKDQQFCKRIKYVKVQKINYKIVYEANLISQRRIPNLVYLDISLNGLNLQHVKLLAKNNWECLESLNLDSNQIGEEGAFFLSQGKWPSLKTLKLNYNKVGDEGLAHLSKSNWLQLQRIELNWNNITQEGIKYLQKWPKLKKINLVENHLKDGGALALNEGKLTCLEEINAWQNGFSLTGIKCLAQTKWICLTKIVLGGNHINDGGLYYIGMAHWSNLKALDLSLNQIQFVFSHQKDKLTLQSMFQFPKLHQLKLGTNKIKAEGASNISKLSISKNVIFLDLYSNTIGDEGLANVCSTVWPNLKHLNIYKSFDLLTRTNFPQISYLLALRDNITIKGLSKFLNQDLPFLQQVDLRGNKVTKKQYDEFQSVYQNNSAGKLKKLNIKI